MLTEYVSEEVFIKCVGSCLVSYRNVVLYAFFIIATNGAETRANVFPARLPVKTHLNALTELRNVLCTAFQENA